MMRVLLRVSPILVLVVGCASMGDTPAQKLAWERVEKCKGIGASLQVTRVDTDGKIWFETTGGNQGQTEFTDCLHKAELEQRKQRVQP